MKPFNRRTALRHGGALGLAGMASPGYAATTSDPAPFQALGICSSIDNAAAIKAAGGEYIEEVTKRFLIPDRPESEWREKLEAAKACPLPVLACNNFLPATLRSTGKDADHDAVLAYSEIVFRRGQEAGMKIVVFGSSGSRRLHDNFPVSKAEKQFVSLLKAMGPLAERYNITIAVEPLRRQACNFINTVIEGANIVEQVNHPNIRLLSDWYHMLQNGENPADLIKVGHLLAHAHIAEKEKRSAPGVAGDDFRPFFRAFKEIGYNGRMSIEGRWKIEQLPKAYQVIRDQARTA